jgi:diguanylate cyclase (GGDEF)-like protein
MGLLERALQYKQKLNSSGKETLIDRIIGPAESETIKTLNVERIDVREIDFIPEPDIDQEIVLIDENQPLQDKAAVKHVQDQIEEDILLFDDSEFHTTDFENKKNHETKNTFLSEKKAEDQIVEQTDVIEKVEINPADIPIEVLNSDLQKKISENIILDPDDIKLSESAEQEIEKDSSYGNEFEMPEFNDYGTLFEIQKEFINADTIEDVYSTMIFSIMGQLGVSSVSIVAPAVKDERKWIIKDSHGIKISDSDISWGIDDGILQLLNTYKGVLDIEDIKNDSNLRDDYFRFTAVDARIITPLLKEGVLAGAILVGEKINSEDFTDVELEFLQALSEIGSSIIESLSKFEKISTELFGLRIKKEILSDVEFFQDSILNVSSLDELGEVIKKNFYSLGLESYSLFIQDQVGGDYYPAYFESDDLLEFYDSGFKIKRDNRLITFLINKKSSIILENFNESSVIIDTFGRNRTVKMELFIAYPFIISGKLSGFITIFKINPAVDIVDIDIRIQKINRFLFPYLYRVYEMDTELNRYSDLTSVFYERIENELKHAQELNIPLSLVLFTIKNYKRFHERFGKIELDKLSESASGIIKSKLSAGDFSARIDRNKFMIVLPGKEKRYSIMLANTIKNEIIEKFNMSDFKLLITSLSSVFPEDGKDLFSILEILE